MGTMKAEKLMKADDQTRTSDSQTGARLLTYKEAARYVSLSYWSLRELVLDGEVAHMKYGKKVLIDRRSLDVMECVFADSFADPSWSAWKLFFKALAAAFGETGTLTLTRKERRLYKKLSKRKTTPKRLRELWMIIGRRAGKSRIAAFIAIYLAFFVDWSPYLAPGEKGHVLVINPDRRQGRIILGYITAFIESVPMLAEMVERKTADAIYLRNSVVIEIATAHFRVVRGYTCLACIIDEGAYLRDETSANPDSELLTAIRPSMATIPNSLLIFISSPYARRGELWKAYRKYYGKEHDEILVIQADTRTMNPTVPQSVIDTAMEEDPTATAAEYGGQFRHDIESFVPLEVIENCTTPGRYELPPVEGVDYFGFTDPSGGSQDS